jgi:hypothetical protein
MIEPASAYVQFPYPGERPVAVQPVLNAFLICDHVLRDQKNRSSLIGIFQAFKAASFPMPARSFSVFITLGEVRVPLDLTLTFRDASSNIVLKEVPIECRQVVEPSQPYEITADFHDMVFEHPGHFDFELRCEGHILGLRTLTVS